MASTPDIQLLQKEAQLLLAKQAFQKNQVSSVSKAANLYDIPRTSLQERLNGRLPLSASNSQKRKLSPSEEHALIQWILDLDRRGFPPQIINVRRMADLLLSARGQNPPPKPVGKNWVSRFINNQPELQTK
jgi:Tc5 transposase DNA-binding domain/helix-turn-helix, Psq domain